MDAQFLAFHADVGECQHGVAAVDEDGKLSVDVGDAARLRPALHDVHAGKRLFVFVEHRAGDRTFQKGTACTLAQDDGFLHHFVVQSRDVAEDEFKHVVRRAFRRAGDGRDVGDDFFQVDKLVTGLLAQVIDDLRDRFVLVGHGDALRQCRGRHEGKQEHH